MGLKKITFLFFLFNLSIAFARKDRANDSIALKPHLWNDLVITEIQNPALTGLLQKHKVFFDFDRPWYYGYEPSYPPNNFRQGYSLAIKTSRKRFYMGIGVNYSFTSAERITQHITGITNSFIIEFKNSSRLSIGISLLALKIKTLEFESLGFGNQFDGEGFNINLASGEYFSDDKIANYGPLSVGAWYNARSFFVGASWVNLTVPYESFYGPKEGARSPLLSYFNAGYHFIINNKVIITPSLQYKNEMLFSGAGLVTFHDVDPRITFSFVKNRIIVGGYYENEQIFGLLGANLFRHWVVNMDLGYLTDRNESAFQTGTIVRIKTRVHF